MESYLATVNLSDFSHSMLTLLIKSLEIISVLEFLLTCQDHVVCVFAAVLGIMSCSFVWAVYHIFSLLSLYHTLWFCEHRDFLPNANMHVQYNVV